jgi:hypothetical protein
MALSTSTGAEVQRPLASVVIGEKARSPGEYPAERSTSAGCA